MDSKTNNEEYPYLTATEEKFLVDQCSHTKMGSFLAEIENGSEDYSFADRFTLISERPEQGWGTETSATLHWCNTSPEAMCIALYYRKIGWDVAILLDDLDGYSPYVVWVDLPPR